MKRKRTNLDFAQLQCRCDLAPLGEAEVLLGMELPLQLEQLLAGEGGPPPPGSG